MSVVDILVVSLGVVLIAGELWFFLAPRPGPATRADIPNPGEVQEIRILVKNGFEPDTVFVESGRPVRLFFYRDETTGSTDRITLSDFGISEELRPFQTTVVEFIPAAPGDYAFACGAMGPRGRVVAQVGRDGARANLGKGHAKHG